MWLVECGTDYLKDPETDEVLDHHDEGLANSTLTQHLLVTNCTNEHLVFDNDEDCMAPACATAYIKADGLVVEGSGEWANAE